jgi:hypothetical protein
LVPDTIMGLFRHLPTLAAAVGLLNVPTAESFYIGGGLTILSRNNLDGKSFLHFIVCFSNPRTWEKLR